MAKKSSKSGLKLIMDFVTLILGGLVLAFLALPHVNTKAGSGVLGGEVSETTSGYSLISFEEGENMGVSIVLLLIIIVASLLVLASLVKVLADTGVIKTTSKTVGIVMAVFALALTALLIANIFTVSGACNMADGGNFFQLGTEPVLASLIINAIVGFASLVTSIVSVKK